MSSAPDRATNYPMRRLPLAFEHRATEEAFRDWHAVQIAPLIRFASGTATVMWVLAWWVVRKVAPGSDLGHQALVFGVAIPGALLGAGVSWSRRATRWLPAITGGVNAMIGLTVSVVGLAYMMQPTLAVAAVLLLALYALSVYRLPLTIAGTCTLAYVVVMQVLLSNYPSMPANDRLVFSSLLWITELGGISACYVSERNSRHSFISKLTIERQQAELAEERARSERLLLNVLPASVAERLKKDEATIAQHFQSVTILFSDVVGFTPLAGTVPPPALVELLNRLFSCFDEIAERHGLEKIKTIGDAYMAAAGVPNPDAHHAEAAARAALEMLSAVAQLNVELGTRLQIRIGLNTGPVIAGVIGKKKFAYDLWGDSVNTAARMESHGLAGEIQVSESTQLLLRGHFELELRGEVEIKGKGRMKTWLLRASLPTAVPGAA